MLDVAFAGVPTRIGTVMAAVTRAGVVAAAFRDGREARGRVLEHLDAAEADDPARTTLVREELAAYFAGELKRFTVPVDWRLMSPLQRRVLGTLYARVPYGEVITYGELGAVSRAGVDARAIGQVMGSNPLPIIVPCHRVVAGNGIGGFSGTGIETKRWLLTLEGHLAPTLDWEL
ncbi:methylated-DNA--protein-cysteine methyltransferase [Sphaerisporangium krabiense]|uniref:methylated-DNA--[protein]-cysteine S-methyltransferase n=1 Tax=Sphaerisporangium krabiense TaxID=763782 RepID=A0A7W8Z719_9ACTN|nr:methylated-DNA--[protein]-cysteine S-methyltransferase [Sphaerisporangium krabiense]MBB5628692.1 methylated-DNA-[protein]-cysteine S-methyltransferase [Sphaerisporangium krabiense]GII60468.1 methylated-DNA--protein-cysteine methyltransferase [Sphaerisporangium krabiense]